MLHRLLLLALVSVSALSPIHASSHASSLASSSLGREGTDPWSEFMAWAAAEHGQLGARAAAFLAEHRPPADAELDPELLRENLTLALAARATFPWAREVPEPLFLNDVVPYAVLDETRERWRASFLELATPIVAQCQTASEAAQALNREFFDAIEVHYNTGRKRPNQSPSESIAQGRATCTGLSVILVDACRAVGIPARAAGVAAWHDDRGNHTWVEVWDGRWHFMGADEFDAKGLDRGWFQGDSAKAVPGVPHYAVWASSWQPADFALPLVWAPDNTSLHAVDVTARYLPEGSSEEQSADETDPGDSIAIRRLRLWTEPTARGADDRLEALVYVSHRLGALLFTDSTRAGRADLNDMPAFPLAPGHYLLEFEIGDESRYAALDALAPGSQSVDFAWSELSQDLEPTLARIEEQTPSLELGQAEALVQERFEARSAELAVERATELEGAAFAHGAHELRVLEKTFGEAPAGQRSLWISMHGGGGAPTEVNDRQWRNQLELYQPEEGIYVAPRAPTDTWNLWHRGHVDELFGRLIETYVATRGVDPNRVYLLGYSAGGDGVYQLAPRMAERFAAASMMAGHPNEARPDGLRNLPFALFMGADDAAYDRNKIVVQWSAKLDELEAADPDGYPHRLTVYPDTGHWMNGRDAEVLPWMAAHTRDPWPERVVWYQDDVTHTRFYWLAVAPADAVAGRSITAEVATDGERQLIRIESPETRALTLRLRDTLVDLERPLVVEANGQIVFEGLAKRSVEAIESSLAERLDPAAAATALVFVRW